MYHDEVLAAYPKGEIFLGHISAGYNVVPGFVPGTPGIDRIDRQT